MIRVPELAVAWDRVVRKLATILDRGAAAREEAHRALADAHHDLRLCREALRRERSAAPELLRREHEAGLEEAARLAEAGGWDALAVRIRRLGKGETP